MERAEGAARQAFRKLMGLWEAEKRSAARHRLADGLSFKMFQAARASRNINNFSTYLKCTEHRATVSFCDMLGPARTCRWTCSKHFELRWSLHPSSSLRGRNYRFRGRWLWGWGADEMPHHTTLHMSWLSCCTLDVRSRHKASKLSDRRFLLDFVTTMPWTFWVCTHFELWNHSTGQEDYGPLTAYDGQMKIDVDFVVVVPHRPLAFSLWAELIH